jgi:hypothetical protein
LSYPVEAQGRNMPLVESGNIIAPFEIRRWVLNRVNNRAGISISSSNDAISFMNSSRSKVNSDESTPDSKRASSSCSDVSDTAVSSTIVDWPVRAVFVKSSTSNHDSSAVFDGRAESSSSVFFLLYTRRFLLWLYRVNSILCRVFVSRLPYVVVPLYSQPQIIE